MAEGANGSRGTEETDQDHFVVQRFALTASEVKRGVDYFIEASEELPSESGAVVFEFSTDIIKSKPVI